MNALCVELIVHPVMAFTCVMNATLAITLQKQNLVSLHVKNLLVNLVISLTSILMIAQHVIAIAQFVIMKILAKNVMLDSSLTKLQVYVLLALIIVLFAQTVKLVMSVKKDLPLILLHSNVLKVVMTTCTLMLLMATVMTAWIIVIYAMMLILARLVHLAISIPIIIALIQILILLSLKLHTISVSLLAVMKHNSLTTT